MQIEPPTTSPAPPAPWAQRCGVGAAPAGSVRIVEVWDYGSTRIDGLARLPSRRRSDFDTSVGLRGLMGNASRRVE